MTMMSRQVTMLLLLVPALGAGFFTGVARAQAQPAPTAAPPSTGSMDGPEPAPPGPPPPAAAPAPASPPPGEPAPPPPAKAPYAPPPGYKLVPVDEPSRSQDNELPLELPYNADEPIPPGYKVVDRMRRGLVIAGGIVTGIAWSFSITGAVAADYEDNSALLFVPVAGPWLMLASDGAKDECTSEPGSDLELCQDKAGLRAVLVFDGITQLAGGVMLVVGLTVPSKRLVRDYETISVVPMTFGRDGRGLGLVGTF